MLTILNKKLNAVVKSKFVGRALQYTEFKYNNRDVIFMNIHLSPENKKKKRMGEIMKICEFVKNKEICILGGDFNSEPNSKVYNFLKKEGFKSVIKEIYGKEKKTWPSKNPIKCFLKLYNLFNLIGSRELLRRLCEMRAHVTLEVEVCELIAFLELEQLAKGSISKNAPAISRVLKLVRTDVRINLTSHLGASHFSTLGLT
jgi:hypothetical protein